MMKRVVLAVALLACFVAGGVRLELVAQEQDTAKPAVGESSEVAREELRYDGRSFEEWQRVFRTELKAERRAEAVWAMRVFGQYGYEKEATETILQTLKSYKPLLPHQGDDSFLRALAVSLENANPDQVAPVLIDILNKGENRSAIKIALEILANDPFKSDEASAALLDFGMGDGADRQLRFDALFALWRVDPENPRLLEGVRKHIADQGENRDAALKQWIQMVVTDPPRTFARPGASRDTGGSNAFVIVRESLLPILLDGLKSEREELRGDAINQFERSKAGIGRVLPELLRMAEDDNVAGECAAYALRANAKMTPEELQACYQKLTTEDRVAFLKLMSKRAFASSAWATFLSTLREDDNAEIRKLADELWEKFDPRTRDGRKTPPRILPNPDAVPGKAA